MRYSPEHKEETRRRIVAAAARAFRRSGFEGVSVAGVMEEAGLTVGGFYRHFDSKEELFDAAVVEAMADTLRLMRRRGASEVRGEAWMAKAAAHYLTPEHRRAVDLGCPLPSLTGEVGRRDPDLRRRFEGTLADIARAAAERIDPDAPEAARGRAWSFLSTLVGSLLLARGVDDEDLAREILEAGRRAAARA
ncbi:MAG: TetR/AcrR family transcriptional regulator [Acidobacteriota bacterium]